jgi:DNA repair exonuclease SbcCD ATPase subunit
MKLSLVCLFTLVMSVAVMVDTASAQTSANASRPTSDQSLQELVKEVRQLRATLQSINAAVYKGQVMIERLRLQQEQVSRTSRDLTDVRENLSELRGQQHRLRDLLSRVEGGVETGVKHPSEVSSIKSELEMINQRELRLSARESQLANELEIERVKLNDLNHRLNALELELAPK